MSLSKQQNSQLNESIASSWQRSAQAEIPENRSAAPLVNLSPQSQQQSALHHALQHCAEDLKHIAEQSSMVLAVGDVGSTIIWSASVGKCKVLRKVCILLQVGNGAKNWSAPML